MKTYLPRKRAEFQEIENIKNLCRLCLDKCQNGVPIYPEVDLEAQPLLATKIMMCVGIEVPKNEELSNQVCPNCIREINNIHTFRKVCEIAYQRIKIHLKASEQIKYKNKLSKLYETTLDKVDVETEKNNEATETVPFRDTKTLNTVNSAYEDKHNLIDLENQQNVASNETTEYCQDQEMNQNIGKLEIVEIQQEFECDENLGFQIIEREIADNIEDPEIRITDQNYEFNENNLNIENISEMNVDLNHSHHLPSSSSPINISYNDNSTMENNITVIENNIIVPRFENLPDHYNTAPENCLEQEFLPELSSSNMEHQSIFYIEAKESCTSNEAVTINDADPVLTSNQSYQTQNKDENQKVRSNKVADVMSTFILTKLMESGILKMEGDAIATCDIATINVIASNEESIALEIVEESSDDELKNVKNTRKKKPGAFKCDECGLVVKWLTSLRRHKIRHTGDKRFKCEICSRAFAAQSTLRRHRNTHEAVRPYPCPSCPATFSQRSSLMAHARTHATPAPIKLHACTTCEATFMHASGLTRHIKSHHLVQKAQCQDCLRFYADESSLKRHRGVCPKVKEKIAKDTTN